MIQSVSGVPRRSPVSSAWIAWSGKRLTMVEMTARSDCLSMSVTKSFLAFMLIWVSLSRPKCRRSSRPARRAAASAVARSSRSAGDLKLCHPPQKVLQVVLERERPEAEVPGRGRQVLAVVDVEDLGWIGAAGARGDHVDPRVGLPDLEAVREHRAPEMHEDRVLGADVAVVHRVRVRNKHEARAALEPPDEPDDPRVRREDLVPRPAELGVGQAVADAPLDTAVELPRRDAASVIKHLEAGPREKGRDLPGPPAARARELPERGAEIEPQDHHAEVKEDRADRFIRLGHKQYIIMALWPK